MSILIVRNKTGKNLINFAIANKRMHLKSVEYNKILQSQKDQLLFKKKNLQTRMNFIRFLGKKVPNYRDIIFLKQNFWDRLIAVIPYVNIKVSSTILGKKF